MNRHASMNRIYRLIWNGALEAFVPVAETARGRAKGSAGKSRAARVSRAGAGAGPAAAHHLLWPATFLIAAAVQGSPAVAQTLPQSKTAVQAAALSLPQGGTVRGGNATITATATTMDITTTTNRTAIDWASFSIGAGDTVDIRQPTSNSVTLNRVVGVDPSQVFGELSSNGEVVLANPNGIWFGPAARVDVAGIVATTSRPNDGAVARFAAGAALGFDANPAPASIVNDGAITVTDGGLAGLVAPAVRNAGTITARIGQVTLASGALTTVDFYGDHLINLAVGRAPQAPTTAVDGSAVTAAVANSGRIIADGGAVRMTANVAAGVLNNVIDMSGVIEARGVSTTGGSVELLGDGSVAVGGDIDVSGQGRHAGGSIAIQAGGASATADGIADIGGTLDADSVGGAGGTLSIAGRIVTPSGALTANGASGGGIDIQATTLIQSGAIAANATVGAGGRVSLGATENIVQSAYATTTADSAAGTGGVVTLNGGATGRVFSSGAIAAQGATGGTVDLFGASIGLADAQVNASGVSRGGTILVGGGLHGKGAPAAQTTEVNPSSTLNANATGAGDGGTVVVWSAAKTVFEGSAAAQGGAQGGGGGLIEVSSGHDLAFTGSGDAAAPHGKTGTLLLDPQNIVIDSNAGNVAQFNLIDPDAGLGTGFGTQVVQLGNGTVLVTKPGDTVGGAASAGSIFYFNPTTGALLSTFQGSHANDQVGSLGVTFLNYTNWYNFYVAYSTPTLVNDPTKAYVISSPDWNGNAGAITWVAANSTMSGILSSSNSLVGANSGDTVGAVNGANNLTLLPNDNYLVVSPNWGGGKGAVTFGTAGAALTGVVSSSNSLVGSTPTQNLTYNTLPGDGVGGGSAGYNGVVMLTNGNFVLLSPNWNAEAGAVTFGTEAAGMPTGVLSGSNSLVGATGATAYTGTDTLNGNSHSNAYYGGDQVGGGGVTPLTGGGYAVLSPAWYHDRGAVTLGNGSSGITGTVTTANSLTGTTAGVGTGGQGTGTYNGSTYYTDDYGYRYDYGGDQLGSGGVTQLANGSLVISSPAWNKGDGAVTYLPAATTALGTGGYLANVTSGNSLVGSHQNSLYWNTSTWQPSFTGGDAVGSVTALPNANYVVAAYQWNGTEGAVTLMNGASGHAVVGSSGSTGDTVSATNSLTGSSAGDDVGTVTVLAGSSNFVVSAYAWGNGKGAVTRIDGSTGLAGAVSSSNSLVGTTAYQTYNYLGGDNVGANIVPLANGNWVIASPNWSSTKGAVTFELANATPTGNISASNSLVGATAGSIYCMTCNDGEPAIFGGDAVGGGGVTALANGNFLVSSPAWSANRGAATFVNGASGALVNGTASLTGTISSANSLVGSNAGTVKVSAYNVNGYSTVGLHYYLGGDQVGSAGLTTLPNGDFVLASPLWNTQAGALTFGTSSGTLAGGAAFAGTVGTGNSLVGGTPGVATAPASTTTANWTVVGGDQVGSAGLQILGNGDFLALSPLWSGTAGAVTWGGATTGVTGTVSSANSLVGSSTGDMVGTNGGYGDIVLLPNGNYLIPSPGWNGGMGAVTFAAQGTPVTGVVAAGNSLVGTSAGDAVGSGGVTALANGDYVVNSPAWNGGTGAATWSQGSGPVTGVVSSTNSILGVDASNNSLISSASSDPKQFFVGFAADNGGEGGVIVAGTDPTVWTFARAQPDTVTIAPSLILATLNAGTSIDLQASNDITVNSPVIANANAAGALTLDAGRSVLVHADISTGDGALALIANDSAAHGVVDAERGAGNAVITVDSGATLASGTGTLSIDLAASTDKTYNAAGNITLGAVSGASVSVTNLGSAGGALTLDGAVTATAAGTSILLATGGDFVNAAGAGALNPGAGRYLVYSADPRTNTKDGLTDPTHYFGETYAADGPGMQAASGDIYLYSVVPVLGVTSNSTAGYGTPASGLTAQITGFIDGDTQSTAVSGAPSLTTAYVAGDAVGGSYAITVAQGTLSSPLGYGFGYTNGNVTVTKENLTLVLAGTVSKTYNGSAAATLAAGNYTIGGLYGSDSVSVTKTSGTYATANAGTGIDVSTTLASGDFSVAGGTSLGNYNLPTGTVVGAIGAITAAPLTATLTGTTSKVYDAGTAATLTGANYQLGGLIGAQSITVSQTAGTYASAAVGAALGVSAALTGADFAAGNGTLLANYTLPTLAAGAIGTITAAPLTVALTGTASKAYDGGTAATLGGANYLLSGLVGGQAISVTRTAGTYASANAGAGLGVATTLTGGDFSAAGGTSLGNYTLPTGLVSGAIGTITAAPLTVSLTGSTSKVYDGGTAATLTGANYSVSGLVGAQSIGVNQTAGSYATPNAGTGLGVSATLTGADFSAGGGTLLGNYSLPTTAVGAIGTITPAPLTATLIGSASKVYDGTTGATLASGNYSLSGLVGAQSIGVDQTAGSYATANAGTALGVAATLAPGNFTAGGGTLLGNYSLPTVAAGTIGTITPAPLTVSLAPGSVSRPYDGGTDAAIAAPDYRLTGLAAGQAISIAPATGSYASSNAGSGIGVTATLAGGDFAAGSGTLLSNYVLPVGAFTSNAGLITPAPLTATLIGSTAKVYDGTTAATLASANYSLSGLVGAESITVNQGAGVYATANAGTALGVSATLGGANFTAGAGTLLGNYSLPTTAAGAIGSITPAPLTVSLATGSVSRPYDGGATAPIAAADYRITGLAPGQTISIAPTTGSFASTDAGSGIGVTTTLTGADYSAGAGTSLGNYSLPTGTVTGGSGSITPAPLTVALTGATVKVYDGTTAATLGAANYTVSGLAAGQSVSVDQTAASYATPNVGTALGVSANLTGANFVAGPGTLLSNYTLPGAAAGAIGAITPAPLTITADAASKVAGTANPAFTVSYGGFVGGQSAANLAAPPVVATSATTGSSAGSYALDPSGAVDPNYRIAYVDGVLTVTGVASPRPAPVAVRNDIADLVANDVAGNIDLQNRTAQAPSGDIFSIGQSASFLPDAAPAAQLGAANAERDVHSYANAYLASIGLGTSK